MIYIYTKFQLIVFLISNITLIIWLAYGFMKLNKWLKGNLGVDVILNEKGQD